MVTDTLLNTAAIPTTNMGASVPKEDLIAFGVLNEDGSPKPGTLYKTFATGTSTYVTVALTALCSCSGTLQQFSTENTPG